MTIDGLNLLMPGMHHRNLNVWATVTGVAPLRIRLDGDTSPLPFTPDNLVAELAVNDRVWVALVINADPAFHGRRAVVAGRAGGNQAEIDALQAAVATLTAAVADLRVSDAHNAVTNNFPTTTSATYVAIGTVCGTSFVAPASGIVMIDWASEVQTATDVTVAGSTIEVRAGATVGSGTVVLAAADTNGIARGDNLGAGTPAFWYRLPGLTPASAYNTQIMFRSNGTATLTAGRRSIRVRSL
jgi:hypothetical protein